MRIEWFRTVLGITALAVVIVGAVAILLPFLTPILWALILGSATWPAYRRLRRWFGRWESLAAFCMTVVMVLVLLLPMFILGLTLLKEVEPVVNKIQRMTTAEQVEIPQWVKQIPGLEQQIKPWQDRLTDPRLREAWFRQAVLPMEKILRYGRNLLLQIGYLVLTVFTLFFVYRDGDDLAAEASSFLDRIAQGRGRHLMQSVRETVRAVFFGWLLTAAAQGLVSMIGYYVAGLEAPVALGIATGLAALIPFGVGLIWIPAAVTLIASGAVGQGVFLAIWSLGVVSLIDNFLRPLFISGPSKVPFVLVFFGVMGGLVVFGFLGIVLGPVFLAVLLALWRQAKEELQDPHGPAPPAEVAP